MFISIEGIDGAGKSTISQNLYLHFKASGKKVILIDKRASFPHPLIEKHGKILRELLWGGAIDEQRNIISDIHWIQLASAWYSLVEQHIVEPEVDLGNIVIADGWIYKLIARFRLKNTDIKNYAEDTFKVIRKTDSSFLITLPVEKAAERKREFGYSETGNFDGFSGVNRKNFVEYQTKVSEKLNDLADENNWRKIPSDENAVNYLIKSLNKSPANAASI